MRLVLPQDGYVTAYVGSQSDVDVFFDDVQVEHRPGLQVQETQYDPAGLELAGLAPPSPGIRGLNNYRFNGQEFQADLGLAWNHQDARFFNPQIFTWSVVDPDIENGQESWSPYAFGYDNAVRYSDASGRQGDPGTLPLTFETMVGTVFGETRIGVTPLAVPALIYGAAVVVMSHSGVPPTGVWATGLDMSAAYAPGGRNYTGPAVQRATDTNGRVDASSATRPAKRTADKPANGNTLGDQPAEQYSLRDRKTGQVKKYGETTRGEDANGAGNQKRYSKKELKSNDVDYVKEASGTKKDMHKLQTQKIREYKSDNNGQRPPLNKSDY